MPKTENIWGSLLPKMLPNSVARGKRERDGVTYNGRKSATGREISARLKTRKDGVDGSSSAVAVSGCPGVGK